MKKISCISILICFVFLFTGCGKKAESTADNTVTTEIASTTEAVDLEQQKQEAVDNLYNYLKKNATEMDDGISFIKVQEAEDREWTGLGVDGTNICMVYYLESEDKHDTWETIVKFDDSFKQASFKYRYIHSLMFNSTIYDGTGTINFERYELGDMVTFDSLKMTGSDNEVTDIPITDSDQNAANRQVKSCLQTLKEYLDSNSDIGCKYEDLQLDIGQ